jgi:hypothetical protein
MGRWRWNRKLGEERKWEKEMVREEEEKERGNENVEE